jgi:hypothetical protein
MVDVGEGLRSHDRDFGVAIESAFGQHVEQRDGVRLGGSKRYARGEGGEWERCSKAAGLEVGTGVAA